MKSTEVVAIFCEIREKIQRIKKTESVVVVRVQYCADANNIQTVSWSETPEDWPNFGVIILLPSRIKSTLSFSFVRADEKKKAVGGVA